MPDTHRISAACLLAIAFPALGSGAEPAEAFLRDLPPGVVVESSVEALAAQAEAIGQRLGGHIARLTNSVVRVHGRALKVNAITGVTDADADAIEASIGKLKAYPFCLRRGRTVIEYVGADLDAALAVKTSYELGLEEKPERVRYRVVAEVAAVERADYMAGNALFNAFLQLQAGDESARERIGELATKFQFGRSIALRGPRLGNAAGTHEFDPAALEAVETDDTVSYSFDALPARQGVPYVTATMEITVDGAGFYEALPPLAAATVATPFWPADDPRLVALAEEIAAGAATNDAKAQAILEWLTPGENLRYAGTTGSRWGTAKALEQRFGHCWDFADCFVTLARAAGVPSRQVAGWLYGSGGHVWAEYYREGAGWQQVDPTGGKLPCGIYHIPYFTSEVGEMPIVYLSLPAIEALPAE